MDAVGKRAGLAINAGHGYVKIVLITDGHVQGVTLPALGTQKQLHIPER
jgi:hypothetical protein